MPSWNLWNSKDSVVVLVHVFVSEGVQGVNMICFWVSNLWRYKEPSPEYCSHGCPGNYRGQIYLRFWKLVWWFQMSGKWPTLRIKLKSFRRPTGTFWLVYFSISVTGQSGGFWFSFIASLSSFNVVIIWIWVWIAWLNLIDCFRVTDPYVSILYCQFYRVGFVKIILFVFTDSFSNVTCLCVCL